MRRHYVVFLVLVAVMALVIAPSAVTAQRDDGNDKEFASGSGKADLAFAGQEHMSFTAHTAPADEGCPGTGNVEYKAQTPNGELHIKARVVNVVIEGTPGGPAGVFFTASNQFVTLDGEPLDPMPPASAWDATDSGLAGGTGDTILLEFLGDFDPGSVCLPPIFGHPITHGNVIVKVEP
jgi:hypothetical protein